jgi:hypothetical protein
MRRTFCLAPFLAAACATVTLANAPLILPEEFASRLRQSNLTFSPPPGFSPAPLNPTNGVQWYDFALKSDSSKLEIRYAIKPWGSNDLQGVDAAVLLPMVHNISQTNFGSTNLDGIDIRPEMCEKLGADSGVLVRPVEVHSDFSKEYQMCMIQWIYSEGRGSAYIFYLFDDYAQVADQIFSSNIFRAVKFSRGPRASQHLSHAFGSEGLDANGGTSAEAVQEVLDKHGVASRIIKSRDSLRDKLMPGENGFSFLLGGTPGVHVVLDRDYWVLFAWAKQKKKDGVSYIFNPKDEQSALLISIGGDSSDQTDADIAKDPGSTKVVRISGMVGGEKITWRQWSDDNHMYSDCSARLRAQNDTTDKKYRVHISITANKGERRKALEDSLRSLELCYKRQEEKRSPSSNEMEPPH